MHSMDDSRTDWTVTNRIRAFKGIPSQLIISHVKSYMGRRKARKAPPRAKIIQPLQILFNCPFCNHEKSCDVKMDRPRKTGYITCRICLEDFQTSINCLSEPIDVYSDWVDACEEANV